jgi:hypothetical protein
MRTAFPRLLLALLTLTAAACGGQSGPPSGDPATASAPAATAVAIDPAATEPAAGGTAANAGDLPTSAAATPDSAPTDTVWLCRPGLAGNPCAGDLTSTTVRADGSTKAEPAAPAKSPPIDCFYVYPTVSKQKGTNATLKIDPEERATALAQVARFSAVCSVYAPMYPQLTLAAIQNPSSIGLDSALTAFGGVRSAFLDYLGHYNHGRGFVLIGHSQGAFMLTALIRGDVDSVPDVRKLLVSALLIGGNVTVPVGESVGGDFANIPACASSSQTGCVVAYSSYATTPPADALFGRTDSALNIFRTGQSGSMAVLCVNPAAPGGGSGPLLPYLPTQQASSLFGAGRLSARIKTPFASYPGEFAAHCQTGGGATWLQVDLVSGAAAEAQSISGVGSARWGLHVLDVNIALGNLVGMVRAEAAAYQG